MHELSLAAALIEEASQQAARVGAVAVAEINVRMGVLAGVVHSLQFCFPSAARGTLCEGASLNIEEVQVTVLCLHCHAEKHPRTPYNFRCPDCDEPTPEVLTGREMKLISIGLVRPERRSQLNEG